MSQQTINIGAAADDGTGDPARIAFDKCNDNFTELYAAVPPSASARGLIRVVYLSMRTDGVAGAGTEDNPYDASTYVKHDTLMRGFQDAGGNYHIIYGAGAFKTQATRRSATERLWTSGTIGWNVGAGYWVIEGQGKGITSLTFDGDLPSFAFLGLALIEGNSYAPPSGLVVRRMTVDGAYPTYAATWPATYTMKCVSGYVAGTSSLEDLEIKNFYSSTTGNIEGFPCSLEVLRPTTFHPSETPARITLSAERNEVHTGYGPAGTGYNYAITLTNPNGRVVARGNRVWDIRNESSGGIGAIGRSVLIDGNYVESGVNCLYHDTGDVEDMVIINNYLHVTGSREATGSAIHHNPPAGYGITILQADSGGDLDGKYFDLPIRPSGGASGYVIRVYLNLDGAGAAIPSAPAAGVRLSVTYVANATVTELRDACIAALNGQSPRHTTAAVNIVPTTGVFSAGPYSASYEYLPEMLETSALTSDGTVFYVQYGNRNNQWVIRNNRFKLKRVDTNGLYRAAVSATSGWTWGKDFIIDGNQVEFYGTSTHGVNLDFSVAGYNRGVRITNNQLSEGIIYHNYNGSSGSFHTQGTEFIYNNRTAAGALPSTTGYRESKPSTTSLMFSARVSGTPTALTASASQVAEYTVENTGGDPFGTYNTTNKTFTAPIGGWYHFDVAMLIAAVPAATAVDASIFVNAGRARSLGYATHGEAAAATTAVSGSANILLATGDVVDVRVFPFGVDGTNTKLLAGDYGHFEGYLLP